MPCRVCIKSHTCAFAASLVNGHVPVETKAAASEEEEEEEDPGVEDLLRRATFLRETHPYPSMLLYCQGAAAVGQSC